VTIGSDIFNYFLPKAEAGEGLASMSETVHNRRGEVGEAVRAVLGVLPLMSLGETQPPVPEMTALHAEIAKSAIAPVNAEAETAPTETEIDRIDRLRAEATAIYDETAASVSQKNRDDYELIA
jgi:hypothetical protein